MQLHVKGYGSAHKLTSQAAAKDLHAHMHVAEGPQHLHAGRPSASSHRPTEHATIHTRHAPPAQPLILRGGQGGAGWNSHLIPVSHPTHVCGKLGEEPPAENECLCPCESESLKTHGNCSGKAQRPCRAGAWCGVQCGSSQVEGCLHARPQCMQQGDTATSALLQLYHHLRSQ